MTHIVVKLIIITTLVASYFYIGFLGVRIGIEYGHTERCSTPTIESGPSTQQSV